MPKFIEVVEGVWLDWNRHERWICCDCSLVHKVEWRNKDGQLQVRMFRENRSTAAYRREHKIEVNVNGSRRHSSGRNRK